MIFSLATEKVALEHKILSSITKLDKLFRSYNWLLEVTSSNDIAGTEEIINIQDDFIIEGKRLCILISSYLESINQIKQLDDFKIKYLEYLNDQNKMLQEFSSSNSDSGFSLFLHEILVYLSPYEFIDETYKELILKNEGFIYLSRILHNTQHIIAHEKSKPTTEPQVYKAVKFYLTSIFPTAETPTAQFKKKFTHYAPDIVLPELHAAVEYKYVSSGKIIAKILGQIIEDVKVYTGNEEYLFFYAVFYLTDSFISRDEFYSLWDSYDFPDNWKPIYVLGVDYND